MMSLLRRLMLCCFLAVAAIAPAAAQAPEPLSPEARAAWGFDVSDLTPHPGVRFGVLPNGMRYAIMRSAVPAGGLSVRLRFDAGAMDESQREQGYFHLLEHLIFHGSENIPSGALPLMMAHRGMKRRTDFNAVTSYDETVYRLDLSMADHNARAAALMLMREISSRLLFTRRTVEAAKKDVRQEIGARDAVRDRVLAAQNAFFFPGSAIARGPVTGTRSSVARATPETLRRLYALHYAPQRATLVVVGDIDPGVAEAEIVSHFVGWKALSAAPPPQARRSLDRTSSGGEVRARLFVDRAAPTSVTIASVSPLLSPSDKAPLRDAEFLERLGVEMLNRRLAKTSATVSIYTHFSTARLASLDVAAKDGNWRGALVAAAAELRRALQHGFQQSELDEQLALTSAVLRQAAVPRTNAALADAIIDAVGRGLVFTQPGPPEATAAYLARLRLSDVNAAFAAAWAEPPLIFVTHNRRFPAAEAAIEGAWKESLESAARDPN
jgi:zinc protease